MQVARRVPGKVGSLSSNKEQRLRSRRARLGFAVAALPAMALAHFAAPAAQAVIYYWDSNSTTAGFGNTTGTWGPSTFWSTNSAGTGTTTAASIANTDDVNFGTATLNYANAAVATQAGGVTASSITFGGGQTTGITFSGGAITLGSGVSGNGGITVNSGAGAQVINSAVAINNNQTWTNNSASVLTFGANLSLGANTLTFAGTGNFTWSTGSFGNAGTGGIIMNGTGLLNIRAATNTNYTGSTVINSGTVLLNAASKPTGNFNLNGGMLTDYFQQSGTFSGGLGTGANQIQIHGSSGFGAGNGGSNWTIGTSGSSLQWGSANFDMTTLKFLAPGVDNMGPSIFGQVQLNNGLDLNGAARTISVAPASGAAAIYNSIATISGNITSATGSLILTGGGNLRLTGTNTYGGGTTISNGMVRFAAKAAMPATGTVSVASGSTLGVLVNNGGTGWGGGTSNGGIAGLTSTANSGNGFGGQAGSTVTFAGTSSLMLDVTSNTTESNAIGNGAATSIALLKVGGSTLTLSGSNTYSGGTNLLQGTLQTDNANGLGTTGNITFNGGTLQYTANSIGTDLSTRFKNSASAITLDTNGQTVVLAGIIDSTNTAGLTKSGTGTLSLGAANTYSGTTTLSTGTLRLTNGNAITSTSGITNSTTSPVSISASTTIQLRANAATTFNAGLVSLPSGTVNIDVDNNGSGTGNQLIFGTAANAIGGTTSTAFQVANNSSTTLNVTGGNSYSLRLGRIYQPSSTGSGYTFTVNAGTVPVSIDQFQTGSFGSNFTVGSGTVTLGIGAVSAISQGSNSANTITVNNTGTLIMATGVTSHNSRAGGSFTAVLNSGGTLVLNNAASLTNTGGVSAAVLTINGGTLDSTQSGGITITGNPTQTWAGDFAFTGTQALNLGTGAVSMSATRTVTANASTLTIGGVISGSTFGLTKAGNGTLSLTGLNTYTGNTTLNAGTISLGSAETAGTNGPLGNQLANAAGTIVLGGGTLQHTAANTNDYSGRFSTAANQQYRVDTNSQNVTWATALTSAGGSLSKSGAGTLTLSNANTYTGSTTVSAGTLSLNNVNALGGTSGVTLGSSSAATLQNAVDASITISGPFTLGNSGVTSTIAYGRTTSAVGTLTLSGGITGGSGNVIFTTVNASGGNLQTIVVGGSIGSAGGYGGSTTITTGNSNNANAVANGIANALPTATVLTLTPTTGAGSGRSTSYELNGFDQTLGGLASGSFTGVTLRSIRVNSNTAATLTINGTSSNSFGGTASDSRTAAITGAISLVKNGTGTQTLTGAANSFTGSTTILGGILSLGNSGSLASSPFDTLNSIAGDATNGLRTTVTTLTLGGLTGDKDFASVFTTTSGGYGSVTALTLSATTGNTYSYSGAIADGATGMTVNKNNAGNQVLSGNNTFTGLLLVTNNGALTLSGNNIAMTGGVSLSTNTSVVPKLNINSATAIGTGTLLFGGGAASDTVQIDNTSAGAVALSTNNAITMNRNFTFVGTQSLDLGTGAISLGGMTSGSARSIVVTANTLTLGGSISEAATNLGITKSGAGTLVLSGNNSYTGATTISNGTLQIGNGGTTGSIATSSGVTNNAALVYNRSDSLTVPYVIGGTGTLTQAGAGTLIVTNNNTYSGATTISAGTLQIGNGGTTGSIAGTSGVTNNAALVYNRSDALNVPYSIGGTGSLTQAGTGALSLANSNGYTGATNVTAGKLTVASGGTINGTSGVSIGAAEFNYNSATALSQPVTFTSTGGTISGNGTITPSVNVTAGNFIAPGNSVGTLSTGDLTVAGTYTAEVDTGTNTADKVVVTGTVDVTGGALVLAIVPTNTILDPYNQTYVLIDNDSADAIVGEFVGLGMGTRGGVDDSQTISFPTVQATLYYSYDSVGNTTTGGNDLAIVFTSVPEPSSLGLVGVGGLLAMRRRRRSSMAKAAV